MTAENSEPEPGVPQGMDRVREMRRVHSRANRMSSSDPNDPSRRTLYQDTVDLADALIAVEAIIAVAGEQYGAEGVKMGEEISRVVAAAVELPDSIRFKAELRLSR